MAEDLMRYDLLAQEALRGVVRAALQRVARTGELPGDHHFFITFKTRAAGVRISERLMERHQDEMTIVLQHQFWGLDVGEDRFIVELSFDNIPEKLYVPFSAVSGFFDPGVQFGMQFETAEANENAETSESEQPESKDVVDDDQDASPKAPRAPKPRRSKSPPNVVSDNEDTEQDDDSADVVNLDAFRKK